MRPGGIKKFLCMEAHKKMRSHLVLYLEEKLRYNLMPHKTYTDFSAFIMFRHGAYRLFVTRRSDKTADAIETRVSFRSLHATLRFLQTNLDWQDGDINLEVHFIKLFNTQALEHFSDLWVETGKNTELAAIDKIELKSLCKHLKTLAAVRVEDVNVGSA